jgi:hypothetical protein
LQPKFLIRCDLFAMLKWQYQALIAVGMEA